MGHKVKQSLMSSRIDFFYYAFRNILLVSIPILVISALILGFSVSHSSATNSGPDSVTLTLSTSCTLSSSVITPHHASLNGGQYEEGIGDTRINTYCNDNNGYSIYAIGTSNNVDGNTDLVSDLDEHYNIHTGAYANGNNIDTSTPSFWGMKLTPGVGTGSISELTPPTIMNSYNSYNVVPSSYTLVASRTSGTNMTIDTDITGSYFNTTYNIYATSVQPAGSYEGRVKYVMIHPSSPFKNLTMQSIATWKDIVLPNEGDSIQAVDERDGKKYWVTRLADGHIWMTQNLDTDINPSISFNSNNTDLNVAYDSSTGQYAEYNDGYTENNEVIYWTPINSAATIDFTGTTVTRWQNSNTAPYSANKTDSTETGHASLGNYYNWTAVIASNNSSSLTQDTLSDISKNPKNSICPKGWRLPSISNQSETVTGSTNEFARLNYLYNSLINDPLYFIYGGQINNSDGGLVSKNQNGRYISSTSSGPSSTYYLAFDQNSVEPNRSVGNGKELGRSVRCIAK